MGSGAFNLAASAVLTLVDVSFNTQTSSSTDGTIVLAGSTLTIPNGDAFAGTVEFSDVTNKNNVLNITEYGSSGTFPAKILNLGAGDEIVISGGSPTGMTLQSNGDGTYSLIESMYGTTYVLSSYVTLAPGTTASKFQLVSDGNSYIFEITCFLTGTAIRTPEGDVAVENLREGDSVVTLVDGQEVAQPVVWVGTRRVNAHSNRSYPVRIRANAFADGVPVRDLLVTPEHCIFVDGVMIPARMLVNGRSIVQDKTQAEFSVYHVETARHSVIVAENLPTESYLDTGNRHGFRSARADNATKAFAPTRSWSEDAVAPLGTTREIVEPIYRELEARAITMSLNDDRAAVVLSDDSDLHLITNRGEHLRPLRTVNGRSMFQLPAGVRSVRIVSRASAPADAIGPFVDDRRALGVLVGDAILWDNDRTCVLSQHLQDTTLNGWHGVEAADMRWTTGDAVLTLNERSSIASGVLGLKIVAAGPYVVSNEAEIAVA